MMMLMILMLSCNDVNAKQQSSHFLAATFDFTSFVESGFRFGIFGLGYA